LQPPVEQPPLLLQPAALPSAPVEHPTHAIEQRYNFISLNITTYNWFI